MNLIKLLLITSLAFILGACGEEASAPAASAPAADSSASDDAAMADDSGASAIMSKIEKADGVVYQDEIYSKWPKN